MANSRGYHTHGTKGGKYARKQMISLDFDIFADYAEKLDNLGASLEKVFGEAMEKAAREVQNDTLAALEKAHLPAKGKYSGTPSQTKSAVLRDIKVKWMGSLGEVKLGFDKTKPGAGGFLITGTPRMQPDMALAEIYGSKKYVNKLKKQIEKDLQAEINKRMGG